MKLNYIITSEDAGKTLKQILKKRLYISNILMLKLKQTKSIFVNGKETFVTYKAHENDNVLVDMENMQKQLSSSEPKFSDKYVTNNKKIEILYEDDYLLIVNKPARIPSHPSASHYENTLASSVAYYLEKQGIYSIHIVTRLDKDTSGICIFAKNEYVQELFVRKKAEINIYKEYVAVVNGIVNKSHGIIEASIARDENSIITRKISPSGDYAKTEYYVTKINHKHNFTVLKVILHTGRTHQIRVHFAYNGHVLLGDELYAETLNYNGNIRELISRQALHARKVCFNHPVTDKKTEITAPIANDIEDLLNICD